MTVKEFAKLPEGTRIRWRDTNDIGTIVLGSMPLWRGRTEPVLHIRWDDGQNTHGADDGALRQCEVAE